MDEDRKVIQINRGSHLKRLHGALKTQRKLLERTVEMQRQVLSEMAQAQREQEKALRDLWRKAG